MGRSRRAADRPTAGPPRLPANRIPGCSSGASRADSDASRKATPGLAPRRPWARRNPLFMVRARPYALAPPARSSRAAMRLPVFRSSRHVPPSPQTRRAGGGRPPPSARPPANVPAAHASFDRGLLTQRTKISGALSAACRGLSATRPPEYPVGAGDDVREALRRQRRYVAGLPARLDAGHDSYEILIR
jgi:hypothetical protein